MNTYKKLVKIDDQNRIISSTTSDFESGDEWHEVGEQESRHFHLDIDDDEGVFNYELRHGEIVKRNKDNDNRLLRAYNSLVETDQVVTRIIEDIIDVLDEEQKARLPNKIITTLKIKKELRKKYLELKNANK
jgi:hypothetical protein